MNIQIFDSRPPDFMEKGEVTGCFIELDGRLLLLQQSSCKPDVGCWGIPGGKVEPLESILDGLKRELLEETGIFIADTSELRPLTVLYIRKPGIDFVFHLFRFFPQQKPDVFLSSEHQDYKWVSLEEIPVIQMRLGGQLIIQKYKHLVS